MRKQKGHEKMNNGGVSVALAYAKPSIYTVNSGLLEAEFITILRPVFDQLGILVLSDGYMIDLANISAVY